MNLRDIYFGGGKLINDLIRIEYNAQGHPLTGNLERSIQSRIAGNVLIGEAAPYAMILEEGLKPEQITEKMFPGLVNYFVLRGFPQQSAFALAQKTFKRWKREGMSTKASVRFSSTGKRHHFIKIAFEDRMIDNFFIAHFDLAVDEGYTKTKSETI